MRKREFTSVAHLNYIVYSIKTNMKVHNYVHCVHDVIIMVNKCVTLCQYNPSSLKLYYTHKPNAMYALPNRNNSQVCLSRCEYMYQYGTNFFAFVKGLFENVLNKNVFDMGAIWCPWGCFCWQLQAGMEKGKLCWYCLIPLCIFEGAYVATVQ